MASTDAQILQGLYRAAVTAFVVAAQPAQIHSAPNAQANTPSCTVRLNQYNDGAPIDERYINTPSADSTKYRFLKHSGITYDQPNEINGQKPVHIEGSFQAEAGLHDWYMPNDQYYESHSKNPKYDTYVASSMGVEGILYDSKYTNWTQSAEVSIKDPAKCIAIRSDLENAQARPPEFNTWINNSNDFAAKVWKHTGYSTDFEQLSLTQNVTIINREERLQQDRASGQLKDDYSTLPPAWKP